MNYKEFIAIEWAFDNAPQPATPAEERHRKTIWDILRCGYDQEELTDQEATRLRQLFDQCDPVDYDDDTLHDYGPHRFLYDYLVYELGLDCRRSRGAVYRRAKLLLGDP